MRRKIRLPAFLGSGKMIFLITAAVLLFLPEQGLPHTDDAPIVQCVLETVQDGDSIRAQCGGKRLKLRLIGIDAPELGQKPFGEAAKQALQSRVPRHFRIRTYGKDRYKRTLAVVLDTLGRDINEWLVAEGYAVAYRFKNDPVRYQQAEARAKLLRRGVWATAGDHQNPRAYRYRNK